MAEFLHTCYRVKDLEASMKFYEALGFKEAERLDYPEDKFTLVYLELEAGGPQLELTYNYDSDGYDLGDGYGHIAISSSDLEADRQSLMDQGFEVTEVKSLSDDAATYFFAVDPDGYKVEVIAD